jgi:hypothetical protein
MRNEGSGRGVVRRWRALCFLFFASSVPLVAQTNGGGSGAPTDPPSASTRTAEDSLAAVLQRADSARAALVQPPGSYGGVRAMDVIRIPFQLFGATLALGAYGAGAAYMVAEELLIEPATDLRRHLADWDLAARAASFGTRSWPGLVLRYEGAAPFYAEAGYSLRQYEHYEAGLALIDDDDVADALVMGRYRRMRQPHFWGVGPDSREEDRSDFSQDVGTVGVSGAWQPDGLPITLSAGAAWESNRVVGRGWDSSHPNTNEVFEADELFGLDETTEYLRLDGGVALDRTYVEHLQVRGFSLAGEWQYYDGAGGTESSFHRVIGDARLFVPANQRQLFALRLLAEDHLDEGGRGIPFTHLAHLGDERGLRGYSGRRFRDRALLAAQLEWRYEVYWHPGFPDLRLEGFAFADAGAVGPELGAIDLSDFRTTPGLGLRAVQEGNARVEVFLAHGGDGWRGGFGLGRSF